MTRSKLPRALLSVFFLTVLGSELATAQVPAQGEEKLRGIFPEAPAYSPYANRNFPNRPLFGDTHLHTSYSMDAGASGTRLDARAAYRFARGEQVTSSTGQPVRLSRPLDFLVVADHSGLATTEEKNFFGKIVPAEPSPHRMTRPFLHDEKTGLTVMDWEVAASGLAAVWAVEDTRREPE